MTIWKYIIKGDAVTIVTKNHRYAEKKSKHGYLVFCKRENNVYRYPHWIISLIKYVHYPLLIGW